MCFVVVARLTPGGVVTQISWDEDFDHKTGRELFGSNLLALTWIKGDPLPGELVGDILRGLGLERETDEQRHARTSVLVHSVGSDRPSSRARGSLGRRAGAASADSDQGGTAADAADADASLRPPRRLAPLS